MSAKFYLKIFCFLFSIKLAYAEVVDINNKQIINRKAERPLSIMFISYLLFFLYHLDKKYNKYIVIHKEMSIKNVIIL